MRSVLCLSMLILSLGAPSAFSAQVAAVPSAKLKDADVVLMNATRLRALGIEIPQLIVRDLDRMPTGVFERTAASAAARAQVWSFFFTGTLLKAGGLAGDHPVTMFLNPLADVAVLQYCDRGASGELTCDRVCAIPGERLASVRKAKPTRIPTWVSAPSPFEKLAATARIRLADFAARYTTKGSGPTPENLCAPAEQVAAEIRLIDLAQAISQVKPSAFTAALTCATTGKPACPAQMVTDTKARRRLLDLTQSKEGIAVAGVIRHGDRVSLLVVPRLSAWQLGVITVKEGTQDTYAFKNLTFLSI